jgi:hypothetical protein
METTIKVFKTELSLSLHNATVIHSDKFSRTVGGWGHWPVWSNVYTDVVFRSQETGDDWPVRVGDYDLPLYQQQEVAVICVRNIIIGYIDKKTNQYYYTTRNFAGALGLGLNGWWVLLAGIVAGLLVYMLVDNEQYAPFLFLPILVFYLVYRIQRWVINYRTTKAIDNYLR